MLVGGVVLLVKGARHKIIAVRERGPFERTLQQTGSIRRKSSVREASNPS